MYMHYYHFNHINCKNLSWQIKLLWVLITYEFKPRKLHIIYIMLELIILFNLIPALIQPEVFVLSLL